MHRAGRESKRRNREAAEGIGGERWGVERDEEIHPLIRPPTPPRVGVLERLSRAIRLSSAVEESKRRNREAAEGREGERLHRSGVWVMDRREEDGEGEEGRRLLGGEAGLLDAEDGGEGRGEKVKI